MPSEKTQKDYDVELESESIGAEGEEDLAPANLKKIGQVVVTGTDWTAETILNQLQRGNIHLNPSFQRRNAWRPPNRSRFIESLILGLPVPQLVFAENKSPSLRGTFIVIDGKQRLLSLRQFAAHTDDKDYIPLKLEGLETRSDLNGLTLEEMEKRADLAGEVRAFQNQTIRTVVVKNWPNEDILYLIFLRLNTGSVKLSPQELRQALQPGKFVQYVDEYSGKSPGLRRIFKTDEPDFRMRDAELLVRYFAYRNFLVKYRGALKEFLDETCKDLNDAWDARKAELEEQADDLELAIATTFDIFDDARAFRKWTGTGYQRPFNRAVFDIMVYYFSDERIRKKAVQAKKKVRERFERLCATNRIFTRSIETSTKTLEATAERLNLWGLALRDILKGSFEVPRREGDRIALR